MTCAVNKDIEKKAIGLICIVQSDSHHFDCRGRVLLCGLQVLMCGQFKLCVEAPCSPIYLSKSRWARVCSLGNSHKVKSRWKYVRRRYLGNIHKRGLKGTHMRRFFFSSLSRLFHLFRADRLSEVCKNRGTRRKTT